MRASGAGELSRCIPPSLGVARPVQTPSPATSPSELDLAAKLALKSPGELLFGFNLQITP